jgi:hypothetical protein
LAIPLLKGWGVLKDLEFILPASGEGGSYQILKVLPDSSTCLPTVKPCGSVGEGLGYKRSTSKIFQTLPYCIVKTPGEGKDKS